ncbi:MAG TPA: sigma-70 family RNA polymerase sigma factor [Spirochaetia bacterium]|nr:sigma-70 family RNA polymerase sigma factor [Spirochaetia bacterium]
MEKNLGIEAIDVEALYRRYGPMVLRRCRQLLRNEELAADAMQETFVKILRSSQRLNARYPSSLLYRVATNVCLNVMRTNRRRPSVSADLLLEAMAGPESVEDRVLDLMTVERVFEGAREGTRRAAEMHYLEGCTLAETARQVDLSISGVRKRLRSLREQNLAFAAT